MQASSSSSVARNKPGFRGPNTPSAKYRAISFERLMSSRLSKGSFRVSAAKSLSRSMNRGFGPESLILLDVQVYLTAEPLEHCQARKVEGNALLDVNFIPGLIEYTLRVTSEF